MQIVSLTTDYGTKDFYVAELKASILTKQIQAQIVDISHHTDAFDIVEAAFLLTNTLPSFPLGTIHVVAVNTHYKRKSEYICLEHKGHIFIAPNNGVLSVVFPDIDIEKVYLLNHSDKYLMSMHQLFADAIDYLSHGLPIHEIGPPVISFNQKSVIQAVVTSNQIRAAIIHVDHFENVIVNLKREQFEKARNGRKFELYYKQHDPITDLCQDYGDVAIGDPLAFFNSSGYLEIAMNMDKASTLLNLYKNEMIQINFY